MKTLMTASALVALVTAAPALAQTDPLVAEPPASTQPMPGAEPAPDHSAGPTGIFVEQQTPDKILASSLIGSSVENPANENLGDINDVVLSEEGTVDAIVIGIGGFLGIGQKNVAVAFDAIDRTADADGNIVLVLNASKEDLETAPPYITVAELRQQMEMQAPVATEPVAPAPMLSQ